MSEIARDGFGVIEVAVVVAFKRQSCISLGEIELNVIAQQSARTAEILSFERAEIAETIGLIEIEHDSDKRQTGSILHDIGVADN